MWLEEGKCYSKEVEGPYYFTEGFLVTQGFGDPHDPTIDLATLRSSVPACRKENLTGSTCHLCCKGLIPIWPHSLLFSASLWPDSW